MATFRSFSDIVISFLEYLRVTQPNLDTKPGTVSRDLFIDAPSQELANLYVELRNISNLQSLFSTSGSDLAKLASNFGLQKSTGTTATGVATLTTNNMDVDILIPEGTVLTARSGITFKTIESVTMYAASSNVYKANATRIRQDLIIAGISDEFAIDVNAESFITGTGANIGKYMLNTHNIDGISHVINVTAFSGGSGTESDAEFRSRVLSVFAGSNTGTALGYETTLSTLAGVLDSIVVVPGDPLLTRDGTIIATNSSGDLVVTDPGTGGKVDIYVLGTSDQSVVDSFIYTDLGGKDDPTDEENDRILGQNGEDTDKNVAQRRVELLREENLPYQPVSSISSVVGSSSGANFVEKYTDSDGSVKGNYELIKDSGAYGGSPFGFDKLHWISNEIQLDDEEVSKGQFNGVDALDYSGVNEINTITQDILITNENSVVSSTDRSSVQLNLTPVRSVSRVTNLTTGERYVISDQNPDGSTGEINLTGKITISGATLPTATDTLQVDYTWIKEYDSLFDFDNLRDFYSERTTQDSVDWGFGNFVNGESAVVVDSGGLLTVQVSHNVSKVLSVNTFTSENSLSSDGIISLSDVVANVLDMTRVSDGAEIFNTDSRNGVITGSSSVILPTDTLAVDGDVITVRYNLTDIFSPDGYDIGTFSGKTINLPSGSVLGGTTVLVNYIADVNTLVSEMNISSLPITKYSNSFLISGAVSGEQPTSNIVSGLNTIKNLRRAPSNIKITVNSIPSNGTISISGTSVTKMSEVLVTVTTGSGYTIDLAEAIKDYLGSTSIPSTIKVVRLASVEKVSLNSSNQVSSVDTTFDITNYKISDNSYDLDMAIKDTSLSSTQITLPSTSTNSDSLLVTGDVVRVTFYYSNSSASETIFFSRNGTQITQNVYSSIVRVASNYGFRNISGTVVGTVALANLNQPVSNTSYEVDYNYVAPKENERITVTMNYNKLIGDATLSIENVRPITADVLIKEAVAKDVDVIIKVVLFDEYINQEQTVIENATDAITAFLNANSLGTTIDASDITNALYSVAGIDRVTILSFGISGEGNTLSATAERNEYLRAGTVTIEAETR